MSALKHQYLTCRVVRQATSAIVWRLCAFFILLTPTFVQSETLSQSESSAKQTWLQQTMTMADARHLAGRTGFGASPDELLALKGMRRLDAVQLIVNNLSTEPSLPMPAWVDAPVPRFWSRRSLTQEQKREFNQRRDQEMTELRQWWVNNLLQSTSPQTERLVLFWHDHFATSYDGVGHRSIAMAKQNQLFRTMGTGDYRDFLKAIIKDPAMLTYLNNQSSRVGKPNENLARELLELFTMGEGHYDEATVKEAARALTGYGISETKNQSFRLYGYKHDNNDKTLFGITANHNGDDLVDLILEQDATAEHLVRKYWHGFISDSPPEIRFVQVLARDFRQSDYNLTHLYRSILSSKAFWHSDNRLALIKSPVTLLIGTARSLDYPKRYWNQLPALHALLGMDLFSPPNVSGWNEGAAFVAPGRLLNRQLALDVLLSGHNDDADGGNLMMANTESMMDSTNMEDTSAKLSVKLAGHFYRGAPEYQVKLLSADRSELWRSDVRTLSVGYDTEKFGEMRNQSMLPWQNANYLPEPDALARTHSVVVAFLNDAAGKAGDRNLFVESVTLNGIEYFSIRANQQRACVPIDSFNAGHLYCAGAVEIDTSAHASKAIPGNAPFSATTARAIWAREKQQLLDTIIALENVEVFGKYFHTISFHLHSNNKHSLELSIDNFACWPDCIASWPACAWKNDVAPTNKFLVFPVRANKRIPKSQQCHYQSLSATEQVLINALYASVSDIAKEALSHEQEGNRKGVLESWLVRLEGLENDISSAYFASDANKLVFDPQFKVPSVKTRILREPPISTRSLQEYYKLAEAHGLTMAELLIGGAEIEQFPELHIDGQLEQQLHNLITHPVYQVY